ncbi:MAG TPA: hypothetical protein VNO14_05280, partial [Blastocatellia bacterium]|nr:hypothetical protein [Blastocatellia bacterium]
MNRPTVCLKPLLIAVLASLALASFPAPPAVTSNAAGARRIPDEGPGEKSAALTAKAGRASRNSIVEAYGKLPLSFELNRGQLYPEVRFVSRGDGYNLLLTAKEAILHLVGRQAAPASSKRKSRVRRPTSATLRMKMLGANASPRVEGLDRMTGTSNYFLGADPSKWRTQVPSYERVRYSGVYTGVDLIYYGNGRQLEFDFHVAPGASPDVIKIGLKGARRIRLADDGGLEISTAAGDVQMKKPFIYQDNEGARHEVEGGYVLLARNRIGFKIARYDETKPLIIDPVLSYSTFLGGI